MESDLSIKPKGYIKGLDVDAGVLAKHKKKKKPHENLMESILRQVLPMKIGL